MKKLFLSCIAFLLVGCNENANISDLQTFTQNAYRDKAPEVDPLPAIRPQVVFIYTASALVDPFNTENIKVQQGDITEVDDTFAPDKNRRKEPLEDFPLDALKLVGMMTDMDGEVEALIQVPDEIRSVVQVKLGNYMGVNYGEIIEIKENQVIVEERRKNPLGQWEKELASVILVE